MREMETTVSMSTATTRSTAVLPRTRRSTPNATPRKIRIVAAIRIRSAKGLLQMLFECAGNGARCFIRICCFDVEPVNEETVVVYVDHERSGRQCDGIRKRQPPDWSFELRSDSDDAGIDFDAWGIDVAHHVDVRTDQLDQKDDRVENEIMQARRGQPDVPPRARFAREH